MKQIFPKKVEYPDIEKLFKKIQLSFNMPMLNSSELKLKIKDRY